MASIGSSFINKSSRQPIGPKAPPARRNRNAAAPAAVSNAPADEPSASVEFASSQPAVAGQKRTLDNTSSAESSSQANAAGTEGPRQKRQRTHDEATTASSHTAPIGTVDTTSDTNQEQTLNAQSQDAETDSPSRRAPTRATRTANAETGKKARKPRSDKGVKRGPRGSKQATTNSEQPDAAADVEGLPTPSATQSPRSTEAQSPPVDDPADDGQEDEENDRPRKKRKRRHRANSEEGDPNVKNTGETMMGELRQDKLTGPISGLESAMRKIDWPKVKHDRHTKDMADLAEWEKAQKKGADDENEDEERPEDVTNDAQTADAEEEGADGQEEGDDDGEAAGDEEGDDAGEGPSASAHSASHPRLRMVNGQIQFDNSTFTRDRHAETQEEAERLAAADADAIQESDLINQTNQHTFMEHRRKDKRDAMAVKYKPGAWKKEETEKFYAALRMFGTDFGIIARMFPGRTRGQIKAKFQREERANSDIIDDCLNGTHVPMDLDHYAEAAGIEVSDFMNVEDFNAELGREREQEREAMETKAREKREEAERKRDEARVRADHIGRQREERRKKSVEKRQRQKSKNGVHDTTEQVVDSIEDVADALGGETSTVPPPRPSHAQDAGDAAHEDGHEQPTDQTTQGKRKRAKKTARFEPSAAQVVDSIDDVPDMLGAGREGRRR